jgi:glutamate synthase (NADPH/NADH) small chain
MREVAHVDCSVPGVLPALEYLTESTKAVLEGRVSTRNASGRHVLVIGNGDTATDCVATAVRQGAKSIHQLVRKPQSAEGNRVWPYRPTGEKTAYGQEEAAALYGKDPRLYETTVQELLTDEAGILRAARIRRGETESEVPADMVLIAAGFSVAENSITQVFGVRKDEKGRIGTSDCTTENPKLFACGDVRRGPSLVVWAIAEGRACAHEVDRYLEGYT